MQRIFLGLATLVFCGFLAGCATLNKAECEAGDWRSLGMADGSKGYPLSYIDEHMTACAKHGISVDRTVYAAGREEGLQNYCRIDKAESEGLAGRPNYNSCTGDIGISFNRIYDKARIVQKTGQEITVARGQMDTALERITTPGLTDAQRLAIKGEISNAQLKIELLEDRRRLEERDLRATFDAEQRRLAKSG
ncbi:DUF2799 domain-containing protein [Mariluticola halotolerans]|uniref:DUF2799 domain-containing protein n=1 Tax=Mariluticola halotolerans TaxID=2909283 RepID=UPI0026E4508F|nr:DUF2799 domain-containing protein [Mariluticola halotolerans]UJQ93250.1 DUF2799 domain-containing protein [Mariluticola halotolerans]